jgi:hypothetical protein
LVNEADNKAFRELQDLHRIWKTLVLFPENIDVIWNKFSDLTKQMHDKGSFIQNQRGTELENLEKKKRNYC